MTVERTPNRRHPYTCHFDFEIGYLVESPCRCCDGNDKLPHCAHACRILDRVRSLLADSVPCTRRY